MSITPALSTGLIGRTQERISKDLFLDVKDSQYIHRQLEVFALEVLSEMHNYKEELLERSEAQPFHQYQDPGDETHHD